MLNNINILLTGESGVGKTTILNLFPGDIILELDDDLNEIFQKAIYIPEVKGTEQCLLREIDLKELVNNFNSYQKLLRSIDIICIVTDSTETNIRNTTELLLEIKNKLVDCDFYIIANFQDRKSVSISIEKVEDLLKEKTFGFSAIQEDSKDSFITIIKEILSFSIEEEEFENIWSEIDEARLLEKRGNYSASAKKFSIAATKFKELSSKQSKEELIALYYLCKAWECMELAEEYKIPEKFSEAISFFNQANENLSDKKLKLFVSGNVVLCEALHVSLKYDKADTADRKEKYYSKIKHLINKAIELFREGGYKKEVEWALATLKNLNHS